MTRAAIDNVLGRLEAVTQTREDKWKARCPCHGDRRPSLSVSVTSDGTVLLKCQAGCNTNDVVAALQLEMKDLFPKRSGGFIDRIEKTYDYRDEGSELLFQTVRLKSPKDFRQRCPDGHDGWQWNLKGVRRVLYRLPELIAADPTAPVFIVEGEKDADRLAEFSLVATTNPMGAEKWRNVDDEPLRDRRVVVLPDNDMAGAQHAQGVALALHAKATEVRVLNLPELPEKGDVSDWLNNGGTVERLVELADAAPRFAPGASLNNEEEEDCPELPQVILPGHIKRIVDSAQDMGRLLSVTNKYFWRGGAVVTVASDGNGIPYLESLKPAALASVFETVASLNKLKPERDGGYKIVPTISSEHSAKMIMTADSFVAELPAIKVLSPCPVLTERNGGLIEIVGYDRESGIMAAGAKTPDISLDEARGRLNTLLADYRFATPADGSRALAALITPALVFGGVLGGRAPVDLGEADASQSGKGFRNKVTAAMYGQAVTTVTQRRGGVGSLDETFNSVLIRGANFVALDNIRGRLDSPAIESFLTEDRYFARVPYQQNVELDPRRVVLQMTSNRADITPDLANRSSFVRILKQPPGYQFEVYPGGDLLDDIRADPSRYLAAVFVIVREWHRQGEPQTQEARHDFRVWCRSLDWIVQNLLDAPPLMDGHRETQERMANPTLNWLRDVALSVARAGRCGDPLRAYELLEIIADDPLVEVPGLQKDADPRDEKVRGNVLRAIGRDLGRCFRDEAVQIDHFTIERSDATDAEGRAVHQYRFREEREVIEL